MNEVLFTVFLIALGVAAQNPTPPVQALRQSASRSAPVKIIGSPTLVPAHAIRTLQPPLIRSRNCYGFAEVAAMLAHRQVSNNAVRLNRTKIHCQSPRWFRSGDSPHCNAKCDHIP